MIKGFLNSLFFFLTLFFAQSYVKAQSIESWIDENEKAPTEIIYVHTDKEYYFTDETIWLKIYLTDSRSGTLLPGIENVYISMFDKSGSEVFKTTLLVTNGQAPGHIDIPNSFKEGNYILVAFTDYLLNFNESFHAKKELVISRPSTTLWAAESRQRARPSVKTVADVSFLPEGGELLEGISNLIAFKTIDINGYGVDVQGTITDETGDEVVTFRSDYRGMGLFFITPIAGKQYYATISGFPSFRYSFNEQTVTEGVKIQVVNQSSNELILNIATNSNSVLNEKLYLVNRHRGQTIFYRPVIMNENNHLIKLAGNLLRGGVNQLILLDTNFRPLSERLIFSDNINKKELTISSNSDTLSPRTNVNLMFEGEGVNGNLSMTVVLKDALTEGSNKQNILSELLITPELNGFIESPASYFTDSENISSQAKLRLLMLTNGWASYNWNYSPSINDTLIYQQSAGINISGVAISNRTKEPIKRGEITLMIEKDQGFAFLKQDSKSDGKFLFTGLFFHDTARVYIQAKALRRSQNLSVELLPAPISTPEEEVLNALKSDLDMHGDLGMIKYRQNNRYAEYKRAQGRSVGEPKIETIIDTKGDGHFRLYEDADHVIEVPENEESYSNILDFLTGKIAGLDISENQVSIRGTTGIEGSSGPLFLIDGIPQVSGYIAPLKNLIHDEDEPQEFAQDTRDPTLEKIKSIPLGDIEKIEILKSPQNLALFGTEGAGGVIALYTRKSRNLPMKMKKGVFDQKIAGFTPFRKFYSPEYIPKVEPKMEPDYRTTLFWEPELIISGGTATIDFFSSDQTGSYIIQVEGVSDDGNIVIGEKSLFIIENKP